VNTREKEQRLSSWCKEAADEKKRLLKFTLTDNLIGPKGELLIDKMDDLIGLKGELIIDKMDMSLLLKDVNEFMEKQTKQKC
jgi:hypothetical protein